MNCRSLSAIKKSSYMMLIYDCWLYEQAMNNDLHMKFIYVILDSLGCKGAIDDNKIEA